MNDMSLGSFLNLKPLDRVQLNDLHAVRDMFANEWRRGGGIDLPFLYFQRMCADGRLELCGPSGYVIYASPLDICDVIPGEQLKVRAMPRSVFLQRCALPLKERQIAPSDSCYAVASVLRVTKDRWNRVDQVFVEFDDPSLNTDRAFAVPIHSDDLKMVAAKARRTNMPVISPKSYGLSSADHGIERQREKADYAVRAFFGAASKGNRVKANAIREIGISNLNIGQINRLPFGGM